MPKVVQNPSMGYYLDSLKSFFLSDMHCGTPPQANYYSSMFSELHNKCSTDDIQIVLGHLGGVIHFVSMFAVLSRPCFLHPQ